MPIIHVAEQCPDPYGHTPVIEGWPQHVVDRFWSKVDGTGDCWVWTASLVGGYGQFHIAMVEGKRVKGRAHRIAMEMLVGPVPPHLVIDHLCRNHACVNPDHLEVVPQRTNFIRGESPGAVVQRTGLCAKGHSMADAYVADSRGRGYRWCRTCRLIRLGVDEGRIRPRRDGPDACCPQGHLLRGENVILKHVGTWTVRRCRTCRRAQSNASKRRKRVAQ
jgi:hypothetical protein